MNRHDLEWDYIRQYTLAPVVTAASAIVVLCAAIFCHGLQQELHMQLSANHSVMQQDYDALIYRRRIVERYHRRYLAFSEMGFVGMESRLDWIETLRATATALTLPRVSYQINPQLRAISPVESILAGDNASIHVSKLALEMSLVHELDLLRFVDELQRNAPGLIKVDRCDLRWQGEPGERIVAEPNILASCQLQIFSIITADVAADGRT